MASAVSMARVIQLKYGEQSKHIMIFDVDIDDLARNVKERACVAFNFKDAWMLLITAPGVCPRAGHFSCM